MRGTALRQRARRTQVIELRLTGASHADSRPEVAPSQQLLAAAVRATHRHQFDASRWGGPHVRRAARRKHQVPAPAGNPPVQACRRPHRLRHDRSRTRRKQSPCPLLPPQRRCHATHPPTPTQERRTAGVSNADTRSRGDQELGSSCMIAHSRVALAFNARSTSCSEVSPSLLRRTPPLPGIV